MLSNVHNDSVYQNDGEPFSLSLVQKQQARTKEEQRQEVIDQLPVLKEIYEHLSARKAETDSVTKAFELAEKYALSKEEALTVMRILNQLLDTEVKFVKGKLEHVK